MCKAFLKITQIFPLKKHPSLDQMNKTGENHNLCCWVCADSQKLSYPQRIIIISTSLAKLKTVKVIYQVVPPCCTLPKY